jgi:MFS family permease
MNERRRWTAAIFLFTIGDALALQVRGAIIPSLRAEFGVSEALLGLVAPAGTAGFIVAILLVGTTAGRLNVRKTVLLALGAAAVAFLVMGAAPIYPLFLGFLLVQGSMDGVVRGLDRPILSHLYPGQRGRIFNVYALVWAVGAAAAPLFVNAVLSVGEWRWVFYLLAVVFVPAAVLIVGADRPSIEGNERTVSRERFVELLRDPPITGMTVALVMSGGIEGSFFTWLPYYAGQFVTDAQANLLLSGFLATYIPGRAFYSVVVERVDSLWLVAGLSVLTAPLLYVAFTTSSTTVLVAAVLLSGATLSGLFPTISAFGVDTYPEYSGPVNAVATGASYLGLSVVPAVIGVLATWWDIGTALSLLPILAVTFAAVVVVLRVRLGPPEPAPA